MWIKGTGMRSRLQFQPTSSRKTLIMPPVSRVCWSLEVFAVRSLRMLSGISESSIWRWKGWWVIYPWLRGLSLKPMCTLYLLTHTDKSRSPSWGTRGTQTGEEFGVSCGGCTKKGINRVCNRKRKWESQCKWARGSLWEASHLIHSSDKLVPGTLSSSRVRICWVSKNKLLKENEEGRAHGL